MAQGLHGLATRKVQLQGVVCTKIQKPERQAGYFLPMQTGTLALSQRALGAPMPFATTYLYEAGFSALTSVKTS